MMKKTFCFTLLAALIFGGCVTTDTDRLEKIIDILVDIIDDEISDKEEEETVPTPVAEEEPEPNIPGPPIGVPGNTPVTELAWIAAAPDPIYDSHKQIQAGSKNSPVFLSSQENTGLPVGVSVMTPSYLGQEKVNNLYFSHVTFVGLNGAQTITMSFKQGIYEWPPESCSWFAEKGYIYTTRHATKISTANGLAKGRVNIPFEVPGLYQVWIGWRGDHAGQNYVAVTAKQGDGTITYYFSWDQHVSGRFITPVCIGGDCGFQFVPN